MANIKANIIYRNQANKIFIYNSAEEVENDECSEQKNTSSITILTSGIPEYHIRIKNNYNSESIKSNVEDFEEAKEIKTNLSETQTNLTESKTQKNNTFSLNEDVLLKSIDDKLYLGTIVSIRNGNYLVKFDDNTEKWSCEGGLKKLNSSLNTSKHGDDPLCVVCKEKSETDVVEVCNKCSRGYHRHCIKQDSSNFSSPWCCDRCTASEIISISDSEDNEFEENNHQLNSKDVCSHSLSFPNPCSCHFYNFRTHPLNGILVTGKTRNKFIATAAALDLGKNKCCNAVNVSNGFTNVV